ncbi:MAG: translation initiation factor IF-2 [Clostridiales bacterium]|jgi:translation initiation factor IF-2|nr:translation initiation factor IF-2 [Clostridiales bacterium]
MAKKRIHEWAKEMGVISSEILKFLPQIGIEAKTHFAALDEADAEKVRKHFKGEKEPKKPEVKPEVKPEAKAEAKPEAKAEAKPEVKAEARPEARRERPPRLDADGNPLPRRERPLGPDGKPLPRPVRYDADGNVIPRKKRPLGPDGKPLPRPPRLDADGKPLPRRERPLGPDGKPLPRRERPLGPDGKPLPRPPRLDADGKPIPRPDRPGRPDRPPRLGADGKPLPRGERPDRPPRLGADGKPLPRGDRPPYRGDRPRQEGDRPPYRGDRPRPASGAPSGGHGGDRRPQGQGGYQGQGRPGGGDRPPFRGGDKPPYRPGFSGGGAGRPGGGRPGGGGAAFVKGGKPGDQKQQAPDKHGRRQKLEASSKKDRRKDRISDDSREKMVSRQNVPKAAARPEEPRVIQVPASLTLKELAELMNKQGTELVKDLIKKGEMIAINQEISYEKAMEIAIEYNILVEEKIEIDILEEVFAEDEEGEDVLISRPPVVVVMGHVDHGKTSLLDSIRETDVVVGEAGGITQHIGAYTVSINDRPITFLDTPGHEAFTAMRMRGAQVTDIAVLVVAADDGVMPQTVEAISHAKAAGVEIIVAINKIDKANANPDRVMQELTEHALVAEAYGGDVICARVSAHTKEGIDNLLEMILLVADMKEYRANPNKKARGTVIESQLDKGRGPVATVLVKAGTLRVGDHIVAGTAHGRIRAMINDKGQKVLEASPSIPVEILGLHSVPDAGDLFHIAQSANEARYVAETIIAKNRVKLIDETPQKVSLDDLFQQIQAGKVKELNIIIKADVGGSVEAVKASLEKLSNEEVRIRTILGGVGAVTESDVMLASASNAIIIGFNVRPEPSAKTVAEEQQVDIRLYRIIYNAIDDIQAAMVGMLDPIFEEKVIGHATIRQIFKASGVGTIGGSYVTDGKITRNASVRVLRDNIVVYEGTLDTLRRFKDDVREVLTNYECGLVLTKFNDIKEGDVIEAFVMEEIKR